MTPLGRRTMCRRLGAIAAAPLWPVWGVGAAQQVTPLDRSAVPFRSRTDIVHLSVTARDAGSRLVHDLGIQEFEIYEDGVRQAVGHFGHHETPISVVLLLDRSGSMDGDKMMHAKDGVINFVNALKPGDEVLVVSFSDSVDALGDFGLSVRTIEDAIKRVEANSQTRLYDAVIEGAREITTPGRKDKRALVILSDGEDNASSASLDQAVDAIRLAEVPTYAIAIEYVDKWPWFRRPPGGNWRSLREMPRRSGRFAG